MAESSILWATSSGVGDGLLAGYTQAQVTEWMRLLAAGITGADLSGVASDYLNELNVTGTSSPVAVNTGGAICYGFIYFNSASVNVAIPTPSVSTRVDRIVLRADWAAQTVRITRIAGTEGAGAPSLVQSAGTTWDMALAQVSITTGGVITVTDQREWISTIGDGAVITAKLADNAVTTPKITDSNITLAKMADDSVGTAEILNLNVTTGKINDLAVTTAKIADSNVTLAKMADDSVGTAEIVALNVTTAKIADLNVTTGKLADLAVTTAKIADSNITLAKMADNSVGTAEIVDLNVTTGKIANDAVTTAKIADSNITLAKMADNSVGTSELVALSVTSAKIADGAVLAEILDDDGAGSGLDADLLDGVQGSGYSTTSHNHTLDTLSNVNMAGKATNDFPQWNGTNWIPTAVAPGGVDFDDAEGNSADVTTAAADGTSANAARRDHAHAIANDVVTFAKMQNIATDTLIGRDTASTGDPENITLGASLSMTGSGALQRAALTGDVTASANSNTTAVATGVLNRTHMETDGGFQPHGFFCTNADTTFSTSATTLPLATVVSVSTENVYSSDSTEITITEAGTYLLSYTVAIGHSTGSAVAVALCWLDKETAEINSSRVYVNVPTAEAASASKTLIIAVAANDTFRIRAQRIVGTDTLKNMGTYTSFSFLQLHK